MVLILASSSLKKKYILEHVGFRILINNPKIKKSINNSKYKKNILSDVSWAKAHYIANIYYQKFNRIHYPILSTDSILVCNKKIIKKTKNRKDLERITTLLKNRSHQIITSFTIIWLKYIINRTVVTHVSLKNINEKIVSHYINSKVWYKNFNSYNIYENDAVLIKHVNGSYSNLMGIPIKDIITSLNNIGYLKLFKY